MKLLCIAISVLIAAGIVIEGIFRKRRSAPQKPIRTIPLDMNPLPDEIDWQEINAYLDNASPDDFAPPEGMTKSSAQVISCFKADIAWLKSSPVYNLFHAVIEYLDKKYEGISEKFMKRFYKQFFHDNM